MGESMRRTKIVATIGPASREPEVLARMVEAGMDVARLNFSHGNLELHAENAERVRAAAKPAGRQVAILQDLPGPKLRIGGAARTSIVELQARRAGCVLSAAPATVGDETRMSVSWAGLADAVEPGRRDLSGRRRDPPAVARVRAGERRGRDARSRSAAPSPRARGSTSPGSTRRLPAVPEEDLEMLRFGESIGVDLVALSFVRTAEDIEFVREHTRLPLIAKIEKPQAVERAEEIIRAADCVMVARGDLGIELPIEDVPLAQKRLLKLAGAARAAVDHRHPDARLDGRLAAPDARRGADVANAILDGPTP